MAMSESIGFILVAVLVVVISATFITSVSPSVFANSSTITGAPSFFTTLYPLLLGFALIVVVVVLIMSMLRRID